MLLCFNLSDTSKKILQEISGLGRKVDGNALQNAEISVQVEDLRKFIIDNMGASSNDWEVREVIPVKNVDEFFDLGPRITNDPDLRLKMVSDKGNKCLTQSPYNLTLFESLIFKTKLFSNFLFIASNNYNLSKVWHHLH